MIFPSYCQKFPNCLCELMSAGGRAVIEVPPSDSCAPGPQHICVLGDRPANREIWFVKVSPDPIKLMSLEQGNLQTLKEGTHNTTPDRQGREARDRSPPASEGTSSVGPRILNWQAPNWSRDTLILVKPFCLQSFVLAAIVNQHSFPLLSLGLLPSSLFPPSTFSPSFLPFHLPSPSLPSLLLLIFSLSSFLSPPCSSLLNYPIGRHENILMLPLLLPKGFHGHMTACLGEVI